MGIRGLTTFIANRSKQYHENYELHDCYLVIDGYNIAIQLYKWRSKCFDCFGGDYDKYGRTVYKFFQLLKDCNIIPLVIFDGAYEKKKLQTVYTRIKDRINSVKRLSSVTEGRVHSIPLFLRELFVDIVLKLNIQCLRCNFECDGDAAILAKNLDCPVLSYDSDFYIFDVLYIPFSTFEFNLRKQANYKYILCKVYKIEKFLKSFGGLDKQNLPLLAVLLGNDYIAKRVFSVFYRQLKMQKTKGNEQQTQIKSVIMWLQNETPQSALRKILGRFRQRKRASIAKRMQLAMDAYQLPNSSICAYFNIKENKPASFIEVPKLEDIEDLEETEDISSEDEEDTNEDIGAQRLSNLNLPSFFQENFTKCFYPSSFLDILVSQTYFYIVQLDNVCQTPAHNISLNLVGAISRVLLPQTNQIIAISRKQLQIERCKIRTDNIQVPSLTDVEFMNNQESMNTFLEILNLPNNFTMFPEDWQLYLLSISYWVSNSEVPVNCSYIYSLILCGIILNFISPITKSPLSLSSVGKEENSLPTNGPLDARFKNIYEALKQLDSSNCKIFLSKVTDYFDIDFKMQSNIHLYDINIIHSFAEFQSCLLHIKYLNSLLNFPFTTILISDFYNGTFIYKMFVNLQKKVDLKIYMENLLKDSPEILYVFETITNVMEESLSGKIIQHTPCKRRRRKRKKSHKNIISGGIVNLPSDDDDELIFDENNKFSMLLNIK